MALQVQHTFLCDVCGRESVTLKTRYAIRPSEGEISGMFVPFPEDGDQGNWLWVGSILVCPRHSVQIVKNRPQTHSSGRGDEIEDTVLPGAAGADMAAVESILREANRIHETVAKYRRETGESDERPTHAQIYVPEESATRAEAMALATAVGKPYFRSNETIGNLGQWAFVRRTSDGRIVTDMNSVRE